MIFDVAEALAKQGEIGLAESAINEGLSKLSGPPRDIRERNMSKIMAATYAREGNITKGLAIARNIEYIIDRATALAMVSRASKNAGFYVTESLMTARSINDDLQRAFALWHVAEVFIQSGNNTAARQTLSEIESVIDRAGDPLQRGGVLALIAKSRAQVGDFSHAQTTFEAARSAMLNSQNVSDRDSTLLRLAQDQAHLGYYTGAIESAAHIANSHSRLMASISISEAQAKSDFAAARKTLDASFRQVSTTTGDVNQESSLVRIAEAQAAIGDIDGALQTARSINQSSRRAEALSIIASRIGERSPR